MATPPTVLFILPWSPDEIGGVSEVVINLHRRFSAHPLYRPHLLVDAYPQRRFVRETSRAIGETHCFHLPAPPVRGEGLRAMLALAARLPLALFRMARYLRRENVRAINLHFPSPGALSLLVARTLADASIPVVLSFHGSDLNAVRAAGRRERWIWRTIIARCDAVVACSHSLAGEIAQCFPGIGGRLCVIHNGVDGAACREESTRGVVPAELRGRRFIACVATFEDKKGQDVLLESFRTAAGLFPEVRLALVGRTGPTLEALRERAASGVLRGRVFLFPDRDHADTLAIMAAADLLVLPSRQEPFGIVLLEAASLDVPVVASRVGGIPEIVEDGRSGALVPPDDAGALAAAIVALLRAPELARRQARALRADAEERFTWAEAAGRYAALFKPVRRERNPPR